MNFGEFFTGLEPENQASLVVPFEDNFVDDDDTTTEELKEDEGAPAPEESKQEPAQEETKQPAEATPVNNFGYGFTMQHSDVIPESFLDQNTYDETTIEEHDPSKALLDMNPHKTSRKWRLIKKFERELTCFDEARFLSDNFDEETL